MFNYYRDNEMSFVVWNSFANRCTDHKGWLIVNSRQSINGCLYEKNGLYPSIRFWTKEARHFETDGKCSIN